MRILPVAVLLATVALIASGGGVHNPQIMSHLAAFLPGVAIWHPLRVKATAPAPAR